MYVVGALQCDGDTHTAFTAMAALCVLIYPIGIPVTFFFLLRRDQKARLGAVKSVDGNVAEQTSALDFLRSEFKDDWYYFEVRSSMNTFQPPYRQSTVTACACTGRMLTLARCNTGN